MKRIILIISYILSMPAWGLIDSQIDTRPDVKYMNYFFDGYLPWLKTRFNFAPESGSVEGDNFLHEAIYSLDHWKAPERNELDQLLIGQGFTGDNRPFYTYRIYIHKDLRNHPFIKKQKLNFPVLFIEKTHNNEVCFIGELGPESINWNHVTKSDNSYYLGHFCEGKKLKFISQVTRGEIPFPNPYPGQSEYEMRTFSDKALERILHFVKNTHTASIPKKHIPFINAHGEKLLLPFDKYSVNSKGEIVIYYP